MAEYLDEVAQYYSAKLAQFGATPRGVDWNGEESQLVRFEQLIKLIDSKAPFFSVNDLGCGYGAFFDYLSSKNYNFSYLGIDVSPKMVMAAQKRQALAKNSRFICSTEPDQQADYGFANGIFNVRLGTSEDEWSIYLRSTLDTLDRTSKLGFAFNCLTSHTMEEFKRQSLYYENPVSLFEFCIKQYSPHVSLYHDYGFYDFTIIVRKH